MRDGAGLLGPGGMGPGGMGVHGGGSSGVSPQILSQLGIEGPISSTVFVANVSFFMVNFFVLFQILSLHVVHTFKMTISYILTKQ